MSIGTREDIDGQLASLGWGMSHRTRTNGKRGLSEDTWHVETLKRRSMKRLFLQSLLSAGTALKELSGGC
jgi:hypothetical protein